MKTRLRTSRESLIPDLKLGDDMNILSHWSMANFRKYCKYAFSMQICFILKDGLCYQEERFSSMGYRKELCHF